MHSNLTTPFLWLRLNGTLQCKKVIYLKHGYTSERMILSTELKNELVYCSVRNSVLASDTVAFWWSGERRLLHLPHVTLAFFSFSSQTTWPSYYFPHTVLSLCLLTESIRSLFSLEFVIPLSGLVLPHHALALTIKYTSCK